MEIFLGFRIWGLGFKVWDLGFRIWGLGFRVWDFGLRLWGTWVLSLAVQDWDFRGCGTRLSSPSKGAWRRVWSLRLRI